MNIINANSSYIPTIRQIAYATWPSTFAGILSKEQIDYMLEWMYSIPALTKQMEELHHNFLLAQEENTYCGYASYELNYGQAPTTKIHKIYILPQSQQKGIGKALMTEIENIARSNNQTCITLNVNRNNKAVYFYQRLGFTIERSDDIPIGNGFFMEDFVMTKKLC